MKPDYKNWMPKGMILSFGAGSALCLILGLIFRSGIFSKILIVAAMILCAVTIWCYSLYRAFDYNGKRQMSRQIIEGIADHVTVKEGGKCLDVGCGSGALTIAVAKRNPKASVVGIDRWGAEYASFSKKLCEDNAKAEGVDNVSFEKGDATHLEFADETFDALTSNYVYHNIPSKDRQAILLESLRTLKKGGCFAIHDIFSYAKYKDMEAFVQKLKDMGYEIYSHGHVNYYKVVPRQSA